ncbi:hypothetical protein CTheo_9236 [Ceratobasidium theobromae]|uniref:Uncharacterized protein n=1 Tax=Ceratobasidium theobromae TaxID=1582974 RepID=A0A5N5Q5K8_9AGAM|nr:hypothetical protein CTheo_9236 [Ceratobasidium theobromae]
MRTTHVPVAPTLSHAPVAAAVSRTTATAAPTPMPVTNAHALATANVPPPVPTYSAPTQAQPAPIFDCGLDVTSANPLPNSHSASNRPYPRMRAPAAIIALSNGTVPSTTSDMDLATGPNEQPDARVTTPVTLPANSIESGSDSGSDSGDSDVTEVAAGPAETQENAKGAKRGKKVS